MASRTLDIEPGIWLCLHGDETDRVIDNPAGWRKRRRGNRWRLSYARGSRVIMRSCPDCPAWAASLWTAYGYTQPVLGPCLLTGGDRG